MSHDINRKTYSLLIIITKLGNVPVLYWENT
jgi:hypothetical protein